MTRGALATIVISSGAACRYGAGGNRSDDTLSREISRRNAACTIRGEDFSTPLRFRQNDESALAVFYSVPRMGESPAQPDKGEPRSG